jgi:hypothetical protein
LPSFEKTDRIGRIELQLLATESTEKTEPGIFGFLDAGLCPNERSLDLTKKKVSYAVSPSHLLNPQPNSVHFPPGFSIGTRGKEH